MQSLIYEIIIQNLCTPDWIKVVANNVGPAFGVYKIISLFIIQSMFKFSVQFWLQTMANTVRFFQFIKKSYHRVGFCPLQNENTPFGPYNFRNFLILFFLSISFAAPSAFLLFEAKSIIEYGSSWFLVYDRIGAYGLFASNYSQIIKYIHSSKSKEYKN